MVLECNESTNVIETVTPVGLPYKNNNMLVENMVEKLKEELMS